MKKVFLTGAAGFIGSNFLKYMFEKYPDYHFIVLDCLTYAGNPDNIPEFIKNSSRFEFWYGSVTNSDIVNSLMLRSDLVVHFAAESHVARSIFDNSKFFETDVIGTQVMMNCLLKCHNVERFIHISTSEVYGTALNRPMSEEHLLNPKSPYAGAKAGADRLVYSYWSTYDLPVVIVRPFNNYGPCQHLEKMIPRFVTSAICKKPLTIHGGGSAKRDWIFVEDHCEALDKILHLTDFSRIKNQIINVGSGIDTSNIEIAEMILSKFGLSCTNLKFIGDRPGQVDCHIASTEKACNLLDWKAKTDLKQGLDKTIQWYVNNENWWKKIEWMKLVPIYTTQNTVEWH
ncbi:TPA: epimerase [Candidatus Dependentiae bacterium]|nr:MAG: NAD-dependent epimerase/dehydratase [candidate division TM6 bacterium GW2011_GWE2_31_21]KKP53903.1 MAG: NAD-dependent epimerase/dehydratase [candidate division TM6 bacterium GW2011_GWF2_33_332]HBS47683.1 epimerase [Candidatus Dependentiae bacterium]HBZ73832.1 epimerase [Candidatus Dependentiae bacterium]